MTIKLRSITKAPRGHNRYCGPAVVSALSGLDTAQSAALIRSVSGKRLVKGTSIIEMKYALARLGIQIEHASIPKKGEQPTLAGWLREPREAGTVYLLVAGWHWRLVQGSEYVCGLTRGVIDAATAPGQRCRVTHIFELSGEVTTDNLPERPTPQRKADSTRNRARRLAKAHDIEIEVQWSHQSSNIIVWGPANLKEEHDPYWGDHYAEDWGQALEMVEAYVSLRKAGLI